LRYLPELVMKSECEWWQQVARSYVSEGTAETAACRCRPRIYAWPSNGEDDKRTVCAVRV
jgi:hypothetical protein